MTKAHSGSSHRIRELRDTTDSVGQAFVSIYPLLVVVSVHLKYTEAMCVTYNITPPCLDEPIRHSNLFDLLLQSFNVLLVSHSRVSASTQMYKK